MTLLIDIETKQVNVATKQISCVALSTYKDAKQAYTASGGRMADSWQRIAPTKNEIAPPRQFLRWAPAHVRTPINGLDLECEVSTVRGSGRAITQVEFNRCVYSVARFAGLGFLGDLIAGLRSLRSLTRGYYLSSLRDSLTRGSHLSLCLCRFAFLFGRPNNILDANG